MSSQSTSNQKSPVKSGERVIFIVTTIFIILAVIAFGGMEYVRHHSAKPMFSITTNYQFSPEAKRGMELFFRKGSCTDCHRALNSGTNMGPGTDLDGEGTKRGMAWIYNFLRMPEQTYNGQTLDAFLTALQAKSGSAVSPVPPSERSPFVDSMVKKFAPESWKTGKYKDMRDDSRVSRKSDQPQEKQ